MGNYLKEKMLENIQNFEMTLLDKVPLAEQTLEKIAPAVVEHLHHHKETIHRHLAVMAPWFDYSAQFTIIEANIGTLYVAIFFFFYMFLSWVAGPILWIGYPMVSVLNAIWPGSTVENIFLAWFLDMDLHYAVYESLFKSLPLLAADLHADSQWWNLLWYGLWYPLWWVATGVFYLLSVPIFT